ncbi:MAG: hypothetical protein AB7I38_11665 [Dehalococcoidia bacterium]
MASDRLSDAEIRRALAELMTLENVDEALGWPSGTASRRRWERGSEGLPPADTELGGVALWFRSTIEGWRSAAAEPVPEIPDDADEGQGDAPVDDGAVGHPAALQPDEPDPVSDDEPEETGDEPEEEDELDDEVAGDVEDEPDGDATVPAPPGDELAGTPIGSGFDVDVSEPVLARVKGEWRPAIVDARTRDTVMVQYSVGTGPLGQRVIRLGVDAVRRL